LIAASDFVYCTADFEYLHVCRVRDVCERDVHLLLLHLALWRYLLAIAMAQMPWSRSQGCSQPKLPAQRTSSNELLCSTCKDTTGNENHKTFQTTVDRRRLRFTFLISGRSRHQESETQPTAINKQVRCAAPPFLRFVMTVSHSSATDKRSCIEANFEC